MGRGSLSVMWLFLIAAFMAIAMTTTAKRVNKTVSSYGGGLYWSTVKEDGDLIPLGESQAQHQDDSSAASDLQQNFDGGFSSLDGMLQWAIGHSDPAKLKEKAEDVRRLSPDELKKRQLEIKELMERLKMPSDAQLMQLAINDLKNSSLSLENRHRALQELLVLVEPIDNASDLNKLGGLVVVIQELNHPDPDARVLAAWIIGKASQNNPLVQRQVLDLKALPRLMKMVKSDLTEEAVKGLYAVSALIRNNLAGQELFYMEAGDMLLQGILSNSSTDIRLQKKALFLVGDLAECQLENTDKHELPFFSNHILLKSIVDLTTSPDLDLLEKVLMAIKSLLQLRTTEALVFKDFCRLDVALEKMQQRLQDLMFEEFHRDYVVDVEGLRHEVEQIFSSKLGEVEQIPT